MAHTSCTGATKVCTRRHYRRIRRLHATTEQTAPHTNPPATHLDGVVGGKRDHAVLDKHVELHVSARRSGQRLHVEHEQLLRGQELKHDVREEQRLRRLERDKVVLDAAEQREEILLGGREHCQVLHGVREQRDGVRAEVLHARLVCERGCGALENHVEGGKAVS